MPENEFAWKHLPGPLLDGLVRDLRLTGSDPAGALRSEYGVRPTDKFLLDAWSSVLARWLVDDTQARDGIITVLWQPGAGNGYLRPSSTEEQVDWLRRRNNTPRLRAPVLAALISTGTRAARTASPEVLGGLAASPSTISEQIFQVEGFQVLVVVDPVGQPALWAFNDYPYQRAARGNWSVAEWRDQRFWTNYPDLNVDVLDAAGRSIHGRTLLENVRATYDQSVLELGPGTAALGRRLTPSPAPKEPRPKPASVPPYSDRQDSGHSGSPDLAERDGVEASRAAGAPSTLISNRRRTADAEPSVLEVGQLVRARGQQWVVTALRRSSQPVDELAPSVLPGRTMATLTSVSDDDLGEDLTVVWEVEPGREILPTSHLPDAGTGVLDERERLGAFLDAVRWGTVASADTRTLQASFRAGITIEAYQLEPVARALAMPRVNLLIADDVGLGKTIEAGLIAQELLLRHRACRLLVVCPASLTAKWHDEMSGRFGLDFQVLNAEALKELRRSHGLEANPFSVFPRTIISLQWLRTPRVQRLLDEVLTPETRYPGFFDLMIVDEAHHCAPPAPQKTKGYAVDSKQTIAVRRLGEHTTHWLFLSATPHNGYSESWQALLAMVDPQRFERGVEPDPRAVDEVVVRRLKASITDA